MKNLDDPCDHWNLALINDKPMLLTERIGTFSTMLASRNRYSEFVSLGYDQLFNAMYGWLEAEPIEL